MHGTTKCPAGSVAAKSQSTFALDRMATSAILTEITVNQLVAVPKARTLELIIRSLVWS